MCSISCTSSTHLSTEHQVEHNPSGGYSETKIDEMIAILTELQKYVPQQQSSDSMPKFHSLAFGGDQLTVRNARKAQRTRVTSENQVESLEGFVPFSYDWHAECNVLQIMFDRLYKGGLETDRGTLIQLRNVIGRRNVGKDVTKRFNASIDFFQLVTECYVVSAAIQFYRMNDLSDTPKCPFLPVNLLIMDTKEQWRILSDSVGQLVDRYIFVRHYAVCSMQ